MAVDQRFWNILNALWSDNLNERHAAADRLREYVERHHINISDVFPSGSSDAKLRREIGLLRHKLDALQAENKKFRRLRDEEAQARQASRLASTVTEETLERNDRQPKQDQPPPKTGTGLEQTRAVSSYSLMLRSRRV